MLVWLIRTVTRTDDAVVGKPRMLGDQQPRRFLSTNRHLSITKVWKSKGRLLTVRLPSLRLLYLFFPCLPFFPAFFYGFFVSTTGFLVFKVTIIQSENGYGMWSFLLVIITCASKQFSDEINILARRTCAEWIAESTILAAIGCHLYQFIRKKLTA